MKYLHDLLTRSHAAQNRFAERLFLDARHEPLRSLEIDIGLEHGQPHLAQGFINVRFADRSVTAQVLEDVLQFVAELRKHDAESVELNGTQKRLCYFFGVAAGAAAAPAPSSMPKVQ